MVNQEISVDLKKPLAFQVGHLGVAYEEWVHQSIVTNETPRLFENGVIEFLMRAPWWAVPLVWLPVACLFISFSINGGMPYNQLAPTFVAGILLWTLLEYFNHRFIFHMEMTSYWGITLHYIIHGIHHKHPRANNRLVIPPALASIVLLPFWILIKIVIPAPYSHALSGSALLAYIVGECIHYYLHHGKPSNALFRDLKRHHMIHHFKIPDKGFGIATMFWDRVFGTLPPK